MYLFEVTVSN